MDAVRNLEVTFRSLGGGSKEKMQEDCEYIVLYICEQAWILSVGRFVIASWSSRRTARRIFICHYNSDNITSIIIIQQSPLITVSNSNLVGNKRNQRSRAYKWAPQLVNKISETGDCSSI